MVHFDSDPLHFEDGIMFGRVTIDGAEVKAGITLDAFERLIQQAGFDPDTDFGQVMVGDILGLLTPTIEAHLQSKHFLEGGSGEPLILEVADLTVH